MTDGVAAESRLDQIAADLVDDHLFVDEVATSEHYDDYVAILTDDIDQAPWPMYIAVIEPMPGDELPQNAGQIAQLLHRRIGEDGVYIVTFPGSDEIITPGIDGISTVDVSLAATDVIRADDTVETHATSAHLLAALAPVVGEDNSTPEAQAAIDDLAEQVAATPAFHHRAVNLDNVGLDGGRVEGDPDWMAVAVVGVGLLVALVVGRGLSWGAAPQEVAERRKTSAPLPELADARASLDKLGSVPEPGDDDRVTVLVSEHWPRIERYAEAARALLDTRDRADAVAAEYFAASAAHAARRVRAGREPNWHRPCFFDPRHGAGTQTVELPGSEGLTVPGCQDCARSVESDRLPDAVMVGRSGREVPYYTRTDVWSATGFGALRDDAPELVLAGARGGRRLPRGVDR